MTRPDFARTDLGGLARRDLRFLVENFPQSGGGYEEFARAVDRLPTTLESMLDSRFVAEKVLGERTRLLEVSPFLLFNVLLRQVLPGRREPTERRVLHYLANLLSLFVRADRLHRVQGGDRQAYAELVGLLEEAHQADPRRRFLVQAHVGNYSLYLTGLFGRWLDRCERARERPVDAASYADLGSASFREASLHPLAGEYRLAEVLLRLALGFDHYRGALGELSDRYLAQA